MGHVDEKEFTVLVKALTTLGKEDVAKAGEEAFKKVKDKDKGMTKAEFVAFIQSQKTLKDEDIGKVKATIKDMTPSADSATPEKTETTGDSPPAATTETEKAPEKAAA